MNALIVIYMMHDTHATEVFVRPNFASFSFDKMATIYVILAAMVVY